MPSSRELVQEWIAALTILGDSSLTPRERTDLVAQVIPPPTLEVRISTPLPSEDMTAIQDAFSQAGWLHSRKTGVHLLVENQLIAWLSGETGETREQILQRLALTLDAQLGDD
ncbi:hypothetical protein [Longispora albida]|uniref:hypothetical protein n=1 Tax=Longispora albida TaxID=203523 RepID=UPI000476A0A7|nr:hypothetical protein [Longispora albida]